MITVRFLGTAGSTFYGENFTPCILVNNIVFDLPPECPFVLSSLNALKDVEAFFITHQHLDHLFGVFPLAWHAWLSLWKKKIIIYGPTGTRDYIMRMLKIIHPKKYESIADHLVLTDLGGGEEIDIAQGSVKPIRAFHTVNSLAYRFTSNGKSFCYTGDTAPNDSLVREFKGCDILVHEATYPPGLEDRAIEDGHSTPIQAALNAKRAGVKLLALVHIPFSRLGEDVKEKYLSAAKQIFENTIIPEPGETYILV